jgi:hypothetical protein
MLAYVKFHFPWMLLAAIGIYLIAVRGDGARPAYVRAVVAGYFFLLSAADVTWLILSQSELTPTSRRRLNLVWVLVNANGFALACFLVPQFYGRRVILMFSVALSVLIYLKFRRAARRGMSR